MALYIVSVAVVKNDIKRNSAVLNEPSRYKSVIKFRTRILK